MPLPCSWLPMRNYMIFSASLLMLLLTEIHAVSDLTITNTSQCYPFVQPSLSTMRASTKKVFAWYFPPYPLSLHNEPDIDNWYDRWLSPAGGNGQYINTGGSIRDRPLLMPQRSDLNWIQKNFEVEIRQAIAIGLDGFIMEMSYTNSHPDERFKRANDMLNAAQAVDPGFRIMLAPGFPKDAAATPDELAATIKSYAGHPSVFRLADGRLPFATFYPERSAANGGKPLSWWKLLFQKLQAQGIIAAWYPFFLSRSSMDALPDLSQWFQSIDGYSIFEMKFASQAQSNVDQAIRASQNGLNWVARTGFQDVRVRKDAYIELKHWESSNSATLRASCEKAIESGAKWLAMMTWNDYGETQMAPSRDRHYVVPDISAYYTAWFKTGQKPVINRDALYYIHRKHRTDAPYDASKQTAGAFQYQAGIVPENNVELVAFLTAPGELRIIQGANVQIKSALSSGVVSFTAPLVAGTTPRFELRRNSVVVKSLSSQVAVQPSVDYQDPTYYAGGSIDCARPLRIGKLAPIDTGKNITIKAVCNGKYASSENGLNPMVCNRDVTFSWEKFIVQDAGSGKVTLKSMGKYVTAADGISAMYCDRTTVSSTEKFIWITNLDGTFSLQGSNGKYVHSGCGTTPMKCNSAEIGTAEKFTFTVV